jgi:hypothetical protein
MNIGCLSIYLDLLKFLSTMGFVAFKRMSLALV